MIMDKEKITKELLKKTHTKEAIKERIQKGITHSYLKDFIYGSIDGTVTTFAIISGSAGANFSSEVIIILGAANLIADGFSMAVSNFLGTQAEQEVRSQTEEEERLHIALVPEGEKEEIRQIFKNKGIHGEALEKIVEAITSDIDLWVKTMMQEELGIQTLEISPFKAALFTFVAFILIGFLPLSVYLFQLFPGIDLTSPFFWSSSVTALAFFIVGSIKSKYVKKSWIRCGLETVLLGACAASLAYFIGVGLKQIVPAL